ncbi:MAG: hypothetical protein AAGK78_02430 [Planctomycetota bacterium]
MGFRVVIACVLVVLLSGCASKYEKTVRFYPHRHDGYVDGPVRSGRTYEVVVRRPGGKVQRHGKVEIDADHGVVAGFSETGGQLRGHFGTRTVDLPPLPDDARYVAWAYYRDGEEEFWSVMARPFRDLGRAMEDSSRRRRAERLQRELDGEHEPSLLEKVGYAIVAALDRDDDDDDRKRKKKKRKKDERVRDRRDPGNRE